MARTYDSEYLNFSIQHPFALQPVVLMYTVRSPISIPLDSFYLTLFFHFGFPLLRICTIVILASSMLKKVRSACAGNIAQSDHLMPNMSAHPTNNMGFDLDYFRIFEFCLKQNNTRSLLLILNIVQHP